MEAAVEGAARAPHGLPKGKEDAAGNGNVSVLVLSENSKQKIVAINALS